MFCLTLEFMCAFELNALPYRKFTILSPFFLDVFLVGKLGGFQLVI